MTLTEDAHGTATRTATLLLVRHGETEWNAARRLQGRHDVPLSPRGETQVRALAPLVARLHPDRVVCSPLERALRTAQLLGHPRPHVDERWQEADLGSWTGQSSRELRGRGDGTYAAWRAGTFTAPGGESFEAMLGRVREALEAAVDGGGTVLVVTHGGPVRAACRALLGLAPSRVVPVAPASLTVVDAQLTSDGAVGRLRAYNSTGAVEDAEPPD